jgi:DNA primase
MITIWDKPVLASVHDIVKELRTEVRASGVDLLRDMKPTNRNIMVTCPFHGEGEKLGREKKPSFGITTMETKEGKKVYPAGTCHCFTCGYTSELPEFVSDVLGHKDKGMTGYKWITSRFASVTVEQRKPLTLDMSRDKNKSKFTYITEEELESYRFSHPYMYFRKLNDKVIDYFDVGYDQKTDSLTFPVHDLTGGVVFVQRRAIGKKQFMNESIAAKGQVVYGLYHVYKNLSWIKEVMICESIIDALTCWVHRVPAVAIMGALPTTAQMELLTKLPVRQYGIGLDNPLIDQAGREGSDRLGNSLGNRKLIKYLKFPEGVKDINEMTEEQFLEREMVPYKYWLSK